LVTGDEEYRSEHSMAVIERIPEASRNVRVSVAYASPTILTIVNIEGREALKAADLVVSKNSICFRSCSFESPLRRSWLLSCPNAPDLGPVPTSADFISVAGWLGQQQREAIDYLPEENPVLREQLGNKRLRLNDDQRRRLAAKAKTLGRRLLREAATILTPQTRLAWHPKLIAQKYDGRHHRGE
jgi:hypothetical protein